MDEPASRQKPKRTDITLADLTLLVRPPGRPGDIRSYTDLERVDAELFAQQTGASVETLPLPYPDTHRRS